MSDLPLPEIPYPPSPPLRFYVLMRDSSIYACDDLYAPDAPAWRLVTDDAEKRHALELMTDPDHIALLHDLIMGDYSLDPENA